MSNMSIEVPAIGFCCQELLILFRRNPKVAVDVSGFELEFKQSLPGAVASRGQS
jgi:hypothetical protein